MARAFLNGTLTLELVKLVCRIHDRDSGCYALHATAAAHVNWARDVEAVDIAAVVIMKRELHV
jgi:hypothetical protein